MTYCTILLLKQLEEGLNLKDFSKILDLDKNLRIDNQYYLKNKPVPLDFEQLSAFLVKIHQCLTNLTPQLIKELRKKILQLQ